MAEDRFEGEMTEQGITEHELPPEQEMLPEQGGTLELDISIIHEPGGGVMSLSDFFGIPVFREDSVQAIMEYEQRIENQLYQIGNQVFLPTIDREQERLEYIGSQVFLDWHASPQVMRQEEEVAASLGNTIFVIQLISLAFVLLMIAYIRKRKKERKKKIHDIHHFGS